MNTVSCCRASLSLKSPSALAPSSLYKMKTPSLLFKHIKTVCILEVSQLLSALPLLNLVAHSQPWRGLFGDPVRVKEQLSVSLQWMGRPSQQRQCNPAIYKLQHGNEQPRVRERKGGGGGGEKRVRADRRRAGGWTLEQRVWRNEDTVVL